LRHKRDCRQGSQIGYWSRGVLRSQTSSSGGSEVCTGGPPVLYSTDISQVPACFSFLTLDTLESSLAIIFRTEITPPSCRAVSVPRRNFDGEHAKLTISSVVRFLDLIKPFTPLLPEVAAPESKIPFNQKLMWTGVSPATAWHATGAG
jgi:hypothetical protein